MSVTNFWSTLPRPFSILAPLEDVTDLVFRRLVADQGEPDVLFTEFCSAEILASKRPARALERLEVYEGEFSRRPLVAQIWGNNPEDIRKAAALVASMGFAGVDINMGCPVKKIAKRGACSGLIRTPDLAVEIIQAARAGAGGLPLSVKTRIGLNKPITEEWAGRLLEQNLDALTIHGRTASQQSEGLADWNEIAKVVRLRNAMAPDTLIIGNGDLTRENEEEKLALSGVDGLMFGRAVFSDIGLFRRDEYVPFAQWPTDKKLALMERQIRDHLSAWGQRKHYEKLKRFFKVYASNFDGAEDLRQALMYTHSHEESLATIEKWRAERLVAV